MLCPCRSDTTDGFKLLQAHAHDAISIRVPLQVCWTAYKDHISHLFQDRLAKFPGRVIWKEYTPQHFGGPYGLVLGQVSIPSTHH